VIINIIVLETKKIFLYVAFSFSSLSLDVFSAISISFGLSFSNVLNFFSWSGEKMLIYKGFASQSLNRVIFLFILWIWKQDMSILGNGRDF